MLLLLGRVQAPVSLDVRDGAGNAEVLLLQHGSIVLHAFTVIRPQFLIHNLGRDGEGREGIGAHTVQHNPTAGPHAHYKTLPPPHQILSGVRSGQEEIDVLTLFVPGHEQIAVIGVVRQDVIHSGCLDDAAERGVGPHVGDLFSQTPDLPSVIEAFKVLLYCSDHRPISFSVCMEQIISRPAAKTIIK